MLGNNAFNKYIALCGGGGYHIGARLYLVGNYGIICTVQLFNAVDFYNIGAGTSYICAKGIKKVSKVNNMRFLCHILKNGKPLCHYCGKHNIYGCSYGNNIKVNMTSEKAVAVYGNGAVTDSNICTKGFKALYMLVDWAHAEIAAAGKRNICLAKSSEKRTEKIIRGTKLPCKIFRDFVRGYIACINKNRGTAYHTNGGTHKRKHIIKSINIAYIGNVFEKAGTAGKNGCRDYCNGGVFCSAYLNFTLKRRTASDYEFIQYTIPLYK